MIAIDEEKQILGELSQFHGTERYYRSSFGGLLLTEGAHYLRERFNCYWLVDVVESYQPNIGNAEFQLWSINVKPDCSAVVEMREDMGLEPLVRQEFRYSDFKLKSYEWYVVQKVMMLKSEY